MEEKNHENQTGGKLDVCRLCLGSDNVTVNIGQLVDKSTSLIEKIHYCTSLVVKSGDGLPQNICTTCAENLEVIYNFKSKAIASDLELSKNVHRDVDFTYIQVSDDPLNMRFELNLEEQDSTHLGDSCVYNIIDGDELKIEPVNVANDETETITVSIDENNGTTILSDDENIITATINDDGKKTKNSKNGLIPIYLNSFRDPKTDNDKKNSAASLKRQSNKSSLEDEKTIPKKIKTENIDDEKPLLIVKNGNIVYICKQCNFEAESMAILISHRTRVHLDAGHYKCSECPSFYRTQGLLKRHTAIHHDMTHACKYCVKRFTNKQSLYRHINCYHNITPLEFQCVKCNAYFDTIDKMEDHLVVHYINPSNTISCNHCDRSFTTLAAKNKHIDLDHMTEVECNICHVILPNKDAMDKHNNSVHQPKKKGNKMYACNTCGKYFSNVKEILSHRETHSSNKV